MLGTKLCAPRDVRIEQMREPTVVKPTDAVIKLAATCMCGSDQFEWMEKVSDEPYHAR